MTRQVDARGSSAKEAPEEVVIATLPLAEVALLIHEVETHAKRDAAIPFVPQIDEMPPAKYDRRGGTIPTNPDLANEPSPFVTTAKWTSPDGFVYQTLSVRRTELSPTSEEATPPQVIEGELAGGSLTVNAGGKIAKSAVNFDQSTVTFSTSGELTGMTPETFTAAIGSLREAAPLVRFRPGETQQAPDSVPPPTRRPRPIPRA